MHDSRRAKELFCVHFKHTHICTQTVIHATLSKNAPFTLSAFDAKMDKVQRARIKKTHTKSSEHIRRMAICVNRRVRACLNENRLKRQM